MTARRKVIVAVVIVAAAVALAIAAVRFADQRQPVTASPAATPVAPATTKQALAALTVEVLGITPTSFNVNPLYDAPQPLGVELRWHPNGSADSHLLRMHVEPAEQSTCSQYYHCADWTAGADHLYLRWQNEQPEEDPGILVLTAVVGDQARTVYYAGQQITTDPRKQSDLPVSIADLQSLLTDPRFSTTTTQQLLNVRLPKWPADDTRGDPAPTTPGVVAQWMVEQGVTRPGVRGEAADAAHFGAGSLGATFRSADRTTTVVLVPANQAGGVVCGAEWHCSVKDVGGTRVTLGWRTGEALVIRPTREGGILVGTVASARIDRYPLVDDEGDPSSQPQLGKAGEDLQALVYSSANWGLQTTREFAKSTPPARFHG